MKNIWNTVKTALSWALIIFTLCVVLFTAISVRTVDDRGRNIFGYRMMIVQSDSMSATDFKAGDLIFVKKVDPATLKAGDIIAFISRNSHNAGEMVTHKIRSVAEDENGWDVFITYGTTTDTDDEMPVRYVDVQGIYTGKIPNMGVFFAFLRTPKGYISFVMIPMLLVIFVSLFNCIRMFSGAQKEAEQERKTATEEERRKSEQLQRDMDELRSMIRSIQMQTAPAQQKPAEAAPEAPPKKVPASVKTPEPAKTSPKKASADSVRKPERPKTEASAKADARAPRKEGRFAATPAQKKAGVQPQRKPNVKPQRPAGYDELDLDNIMAEFRPVKK